MKKVISVIVGLLLTAGLVNAQSDTTLKYTEVVAVDSMSKQILYQRARLWANDVFKDSKNVIQIDDKETGEIAGKAKFGASLSWNLLGKRSWPTTVNFKFDIIVKDGKYKYIFSDLTEEYYGFLVTSAKENPYKIKGVSKSNVDLIWATLKESCQTNMTVLEVV